MKILDISIKDKEGKLIRLEEAQLIKDHGILGDRKAGPGDKQLSILSLKTREAIDQLKDQGLCIPRFYANLTLEGLDPSTLKLGQELRLGRSLLKISQLGKECFPECSLVKEGKECDLAREAIFARVIKGGKIILDQELEG